MTEADRQAFAGKMKRAVAAAAARGEHAYGYQVRDGAILLLTRPAERRRKSGLAPAQPVAHHRAVRRGVQGSLL